MTTPREARNFLYDICTLAWADRGPIEYEDVPLPPGDEFAIPPKLPIPWMRLTMKHETGRLATLTDGLGLQRFERAGTFWAQTFFPIGSGLIGPEDGAMLIMTALEKPKRVIGVTSPACVLLRNVRMQPTGSTGHWYQTNVLADFEYDEVK